MKHQLSLEIPDTNNTQIFRIFDTSQYATDFAAKCGYLQITSPGFKLPVQIEALPYFNLVLNACTLGLFPGNCGDDSSCLPDGIYNIKYSVSPNDKVYVEYNYLRITETLNIYFGELCKLDISGCEPPVEIKNKLKELRFIKSLLDTAKVKVEYCDSSFQGMEIFLYAQKRLGKFSSPCLSC